MTLKYPTSVYVTDKGEIEMTTTATKLRPAVTQCRDEIYAVVRSLADLGLDDPGPAWEKKGLAVTAATIVADLAGDDAKVASRTHEALMTLLWPHRPPEQAGRPDWWSTPLGQLCARVAVNDDTVGVSHATAAAMLGLTKGTIGQMVTRGNLERHSGGGAGPTATGVSRAGVLRRIISLNL